MGKDSHAGSYPVTPLHTLIIPTRHVPTFFELGQAEINACTFIVKDQKKRIEAEDHSVDGFNIGMNNGASAGQTPAPTITAIWELWSPRSQSHQLPTLVNSSAFLACHGVSP